MDTINSEYDYRWCNQFYGSWTGKGLTRNVGKDKQRSRAGRHQLKVIPLLFLCLTLNIAGAQNWQVEVVGKLPFKTSNNAQSLAHHNGEPHLFTFGGIDSTLLFSGIHLKSAGFNISNSTPFLLPNLPDTLGKIAAAASTVKNRIYIIGGYHVFADGHEVSSNKVNVFNPESLQYEADGSPIPIAIDDQVQAVWQDSLIYVITGWSNTTNVNDVQVYNPSKDTWMTATAVPDNQNYEAFGASGVIIGNTIYYLGGARMGASFPITWTLRMGEINPTNPSEISWSDSVLSLNQRFYRAGAVDVSGYPAWIGGSNFTYNYNGLAYSNNAVVQPSGRTYLYIPRGSGINQNQADLPMDIRGVAELDAVTKLIAGGIKTNREVSDEVLQLVWGYPASTVFPFEETSFYPNPASNILIADNIQHLSLLDAEGRIVYDGPGGRIDISLLANGIYYIIGTLEPQFSDGTSDVKYRIKNEVRRKLIISK